MQKRAEIANKAEFAQIRYAQCWEDADVLLRALPVNSADTLVSVASAGDNTLALVGAGARKVIAVDLSPSQIACLELRVAALKALTHTGFLQLLGQTACDSRRDLYRRCRPLLGVRTRQFWDRQPRLIDKGIAQVGRFERYLDWFRRIALPLTQRQSVIRNMLRSRSTAARQQLYSRYWDNPRWQILCRLFFSRHALGRWGRDRAFTAYADQSVWDSLQTRLPHALIKQCPAENPYLRRILEGPETTVLPWSWRPENFARIRDNLDALEIYCESLESLLQKLPDGSVQGLNLSDVFEYMSEPHFEALLEEIARAGACGCRLVYWNVVTERTRPERLGSELNSLSNLARHLHADDKAFFYRQLVIEEVV